MTASSVTSLTIRKLSKNYQKTIKKLSENYQKTIKKLSKNYQKTIRKLSENYQETIKKLSENYQKTIRKLSKNYSPSQSFLEKVTVVTLVTVKTLTFFFYPNRKIFANIVTQIVCPLDPTKSKEESDEKTDRKKNKRPIESVAIPVHKIIHIARNHKKGKPANSKLFNPATRILWS